MNECYSKSQKIEQTLKQKAQNKISEVTAKTVAVKQRITKFPNKKMKSLRLNQSPAKYYDAHGRKTMQELGVSEYVRNKKEGKEAEMEEEKENEEEKGWER